MCVWKFRIRRWWKEIGKYKCLFIVGGKNEEGGNQVGTMSGRMVGGEWDPHAYHAYITWHHEYFILRGMGTLQYSP